MSNSVNSKFRLSRNFSEVPFYKLSAFQLNLLFLTSLISNFDASKFRVSRSSFSVPNIQIHSN